MSRLSNYEHVSLLERIWSGILKDKMNNGESLSDGRKLLASGGKSWYGHGLKY